MPPRDLPAIDAEASALMKRGIRLMSDGGEASAREALTCFDRALELRNQLPAADAPWVRYGVAACWLNRAEALTRLGEPADLAAALTALDAAVTLLGTLPLDDDVRFTRRLAIAHHHRGLVLHARGSASTPAAIAALADAIAVVRPREADELTLAEVGISVRHLLCRVVADQLDRETAVSDAVHAATDAVDDGLALVRRWEERGVTRFRAVAGDLFQFGVRVYARFQPQFLQEFILEHADAQRWSRD